MLKGKISVEMKKREEEKGGKGMKKNILQYFYKKTN